MKRSAEDLFHEVADLSPDARTRYFIEHQVEEDIRREVEALLQFDGGPNTGLMQDIGEIAGQALGRFEARGRLCGPYRLQDLLGQGGMGAVYSAQRVDGEVTNQVAVKLLRPGANGPELRRRFLAERQILATLSHPNIAHLLDAGHCEAGQPYLVMEYVEGIPIDQYAAELGVRQKVRMFLKVCSAVEYLHRNLVVHRDLKPSNILVTRGGEPKLLDFGIARMLDLSGDATMTAMRMLTPDYASPEQISGEPVSTATDIYSLGAVLYRLLTGQVPRATGRQITHPGKIAPGLDGDLGLIVMKALRQEPAERYATVDQFAEDLESYLASRPIRARKGDTWYHTRKFVRRYWLPIAATAFAVGGLTAGVILADHQRAIAQRRFLQVRQLASQLLDIDTLARSVPGNTKVRMTIVDTSLDYLRRLAGDVDGDPELSLEIANAYLRVARVQGVPASFNLGQFAQARESLRKAEEFVGPVLAADPENRQAILTSAEIAHDRTILANSLRDHQGVRANGPIAAAQVDRLLSKGKPDANETKTALKIYDNVAVAFLNEHLFPEAIHYAQQALDVAKSSGGGSSFPLGLLANAYRQTGNLDAALSAIRQSRRLIEAAMAAKPEAGNSLWPDLYSALFREGVILGQDQGISLDRPKEAVEQLQRALNLAEEAAQKDAADYGSRDFVSASGRQLANILRHSSPSRALEVYDLCLRRIREVEPNLRARREEARSLTQSAYALRALHRPREARQRIDAAFRILRATGDYPAKKIDLNSEATLAVTALADHYAETGDVKEAAKMYQDLVASITALKPDMQNDLTTANSMSYVYEPYARILRRAGRSNEAEEIAARRVELWAAWDRKLPNNPFIRRQLEEARRQ